MSHGKCVDGEICRDGGAQGRHPRAARDLAPLPPFFIREETPALARALGISLRSGQYLNLRMRWHPKLISSCTERRVFDSFRVRAERQSGETSPMAH